MKKQYIVAVGVVLGLGISGYAVAEVATGELSACVSKGGEAHLIVPGFTKMQECEKGEQLVSWNIMGSQGPKGDKGDTGPQGPAASSTWDESRFLALEGKVSYLEQLISSSTTATTSTPIIRCSVGIMGQPACAKVLAIMSGGGSNGSGSSHQIPQIDSVRGFLYFGQMNSFSLGTISSTSIGFERRVGLGELATYDLNASNTPTFDEFVSHLTNGIDETLNIGTGAFAADGTTLTGSASGNAESASNRTNGTPDLQGKQIDFIRFIITKNNYSQSTFTLDTDIEVTTEIWEK